MHKEFAVVQCGSNQVVAMYQQRHGQPKTMNNIPLTIVKANDDEDEIHGTCFLSSAQGFVKEGKTLIEETALKGSPRWAIEQNGGLIIYE